MRHWHFFVLMVLGLTLLDGAAVAIAYWLVTGIWLEPPSGYWLVWLIVIPTFAAYFTWLRADSRRAAPS